MEKQERLILLVTWKNLGERRSAMIPTWEVTWCVSAVDKGQLENIVGKSEVIQLKVRFTDGWKNDDLNRITFVHFILSIMRSH